jgi:fatty acid desaturase
LKPFLRFLPGILLLEIAAAALVYALLIPGAQQGFWLPVAVLGGVVTLLAAVWFGAIAEQVRKDALLNARAQHARERETLVVTAEMDKRAALEQSHQRILRETARAQAQANWRLGLGLAGLLALGGVLLAIELMTVGLLVMAATGGLVGGYLLRARQSSRWLGSNEREPPLLAERAVRTIEAPDLRAR